MSSKTQRIHWNSRQWYRYFLKDSITVYCGCNSEFYKALVNDYMSENVVVNGFSIGVPEKVIGHYLSLVVVVQPHQSNMYLFDPMFNGVYSLVNGEIPDIRYLIYLIRKNRTDLFTFKTHDDLSSYLLRFKHNFSNSNALFDLAYPYYYEASVNEHFPVKLRAKRTLDHYLKTEFAKTYQQIARYHQGKNLSYETSKEFKNCLLYVKDVYGPYKKEIKAELDIYMNESLARLDTIFDSFGMKVQSGTE